MSTVLVVDDEPLVLDVVARYLERDGHRVVTAADGDGALRMIEREEPNLVLLDVMLPGKTDGLDLCRWIRSSSELPVILLTARGDEADRIVGLELGADDYVTKPFSPRELASRVKTVLRRAHSGPAPAEHLSLASLELDAAGRIRLPRHLIEHAGLDGPCMVVGVADHLEIWSAGRWAEHDAEISATAVEIAEELAGGVGG